jgi:transcriptional repressor NrdR
MKCPYCGADNNTVVDSRAFDSNSGIRRRRECLNCGKRFTTFEKAEPMSLYIVKKNKGREPFNKEKVKRGIMNSCRKRPVSTMTIDKMVDEIEAELLSMGEKEAPSSKIGELIMDKLRDTDDVAYVRFASVYHEFDDVETFITEIRKMKKRKGTQSNGDEQQ